MPSYKLTYFNIRGRAELTRLVFAATGTQYEDNRIEREKWPAMKECKYFCPIYQLGPRGGRVI